MDNHLGNNERFSILPGHKSSRHSPHPHLVVKFPVGYISWWPVTKKNNERRVLVRCVIPSPAPPPLIFVWLECARCRWRSRQDYFPLFPLVNSSFGNNENSAIARKCAWAVRSRCNRVSLYFLVRTTTDWNHLSDGQVKAPTLEDFKRWIATQSTI